MFVMIQWDKNPTYAQGCDFLNAIHRMPSNLLTSGKITSKIAGTGREWN